MVPPAVILKIWVRKDRLELLLDASFELAREAFHHRARATFNKLPHERLDVEPRAMGMEARLARVPTAAPADEGRYFVECAVASAGSMASVVAGGRTVAAVRRPIAALLLPTLPSAAKQIAGQATNDVPQKITANARYSQHVILET
jgi:hypothetical protein